MSNRHQSVLLTEAISALSIKPDGIYIDGTFGRGGHARAILAALGPTGRLIAIDKDPAAIIAAQTLTHDARFQWVHGSFAHLAEHAKTLDVCGQVDGILLDLGVSSPQLDQAERGFSFSQEGPLDMRMDTSQGESVAAWLSHIDEATLADILWRYGEEKQSRRIARAIVQARQHAAINTTTQLATIIAEVMPSQYQLGKHPATRSFQALRIFINRELEDLQHGLAQIEPVLKVGGRLVVISFHSLEDRMVKQFMQQAVQGPELPRGLPLRECDIVRKQKWSWCIKMAKPTIEEIANNPRSRSAILRAVEKL